MDLFTVARGPGPRELVLSGELDASNVQALVNALAGQHEQPGDLALDLRKLSFMDSVGLSAIVAAARRMQEGNLVLRSPQRPVAKVFELSGVLGALPNLVVEDAATDD